MHENEDSPDELKDFDPEIFLGDDAPCINWKKPEPRDRPWLGRVVLICTLFVAIAALVVLAR